MNKNEALEIKADLESKKLANASVEGQLKSEKQKLKETFKVGSAKEANARVASLTEELNGRNEKLNNLTTDFKEKHKDLLEG
jgi:hypothetical protein